MSDVKTIKQTSAVNDLIKRASNLHSCTSNDWISCTWTPTAERWLLILQNGSLKLASPLVLLFYYIFAEFTTLFGKVVDFSSAVDFLKFKERCGTLEFLNPGGSQKFCSWAFGNANSVSIFGSSAVSKSDCHPPFPVLRATWRSAGAQENSAGRALLGGLGQRHVLAVSHLVTGETLGSFGRCAWYRYIPWTLDVSRMVTWVPRFNKKRTLQQTERTERTQKRHRGPCSWRFLICNNPCSMVSQAISIHFILPKRQLPHATAPGLHWQHENETSPPVISKWSPVWRQPRLTASTRSSFRIIWSHIEFWRFEKIWRSQIFPIWQHFLVGFLSLHTNARVARLKTWRCALGRILRAKLVGCGNVASCCCQHQSFQQSFQASKPVLSRENCWKKVVRSIASNPQEAGDRRAFGGEMNDQFFSSEKMEIDQVGRSIIFLHNHWGYPNAGYPQSGHSGLAKLVSPKISQKSW